MTIEQPVADTVIKHDLSILPNLSVITTQGEVNLATLVGQPLILYFYPKDATPGCTTQARDFRDLMPEFAALGVRIIGVSRDSLKAHEKFTANECLPFPLISDSDETLCRYYDVIKEKNMYGKVVLGIQRSTFLYDKHGKLVESWRKVSPPGHAEMLLGQVKLLV
ncbi:peroxiredoxin [Aquirhabdus sp.]|uniref:peroxiredoxin n=1 Tax=Aquirhabdus sp. TaxID=2824160 RepID=UPI00396C4BA6